MKKIKEIYHRAICFNVDYYDARKVLELHALIEAGNGGVLLHRKYRKLCLKYGCFIPATCKIGSNLSLPHGLNGIFISQDAVIGDDCTIFHQVTIGSNNLKDSAGLGAPTVGNNVYIGAGAKIIGACKVGNNVRIGANAVITKDVPDNSTVVGVQNRVIIHDKIKDNSFIPR